MSEQRFLVWVVDDSATERAAILAALGSDYRYQQFSDGSEVVERLAANELPDVMLLDWVMPGMSGDDVCRYARAQPHTIDLPIILCTSSRIETLDVVEGLRLGANDYVAKPFAVEELRARVQSVLRANTLREAATRERTRLDAINRLGRTLFAAGSDVSRIIDELLASLTGLVADGCAITLLPGELPPISASKHNADPTGKALAAIAMLADPATFAFDTPAQALEQLPAPYHDYIRTFGLRGLAIMPFPIRNPILGVVTMTRDGHSQPFDVDDLATIETCIEYASLAVQNATRFDAERAARGQLHAILQHAPIGIVVTSADGLVTLANPSASRLMPGIENVKHVYDVYDLGLWSTVDGKELTREAWASLRTATSTESSRRELALVVGNVRRVLSLATVPLRDVPGLSGSVTSIEDVTPQYTIIAERERIAAFQEQMLGIVGHDLRNPLNAVITGAELILMNDQAQLPARRILSSGNRMASIVNTLLDVTRARLGNGIPVTLSPTSLGPIVQDVVEELAASAPSRFRLSIPNEIRGNWDADRLGQVVSNLASNALQYGHPEAPIEIAVASSGTTATIAVTNTLRDTPIPEDRIAILFDPYRRGHESTTMYRSGLGLGLYIAHEIVRAHHGTISVVSTPAGTTFTVHLPVDAAISHSA